MFIRICIKNSTSVVLKQIHQDVILKTLHNVHKYFLFVSLVFKISKTYFCKPSKLKYVRI